MSPTVDFIHQISIHGQVYDGTSFISLEIAGLQAIINLSIAAICKEERNLIIGI